MDLKFKIRKRTQPEWLTWLLVFVPFTFGTLFDFLPLPNLFKYLIDVAWIMLLVLAVLNIYMQRVKLTSAFKILSVWIISFLIFTLLVYIFNYQSVFYYVMGVRNYFRFYAAFLSFIVFLNEDDVDVYMKAYDALFWINAVIMLFQFAIFDYKQDLLGGLFGTQVGCNGYVNVFLIIICARAVICYLNKTEKTGYVLAKCATSLVLATLAEIKFFYIEFIFIILVAVFVSGNSFRKIAVILGGLIAMIVFINLLFIIFPYFSEFDTISKLMEYQLKGYSGAGTVGRLNAIQMVSDLFLDTIPKKLTGLGLGNCETSNIDFLNTPFYKEHGFIRYFWFTTSHITLETGYIGFTFFVGFFVLVFVLSLLLSKRNVNNRDYCYLAMVVAVCSILVVIYNSSLRTEASYMLYFVLSLPFIERRNQKNEGVLNE